MTEIPLSVRAAAAAMRAGDLTSVELTEACLARADAHDAELGSYLLRFDEHALASAAAADADLAAGVDHGPMQGIPIGMKDILAMSEGPTTGNSLVLDPAWGADKDGPVVRRLKDSGSVITGKVTTMEFAIGMPDFDKPFPIPRNPWDTSTWPGGSSSGTGNGIAAGFFLAGIGTDTGGSIRIPAAFCGVSGLMPTFGRVPKSGCVPLGFTLDHIGPLARTAWDCGAMLQVLAGYDPSDPNCVDRPVPDFLDGVDDGIAGMRIGVMREHHFVEAHDGTEAAFDAAVAQLEALGAEVVELSIPYYAEVAAAAMVTMCGEAAAYHRNDLQSRWGDYFAQTRAIVSWGTLASAADYVQAQRVRRVGQQALAEVFAGVDVIATPTSSVGSPTFESVEGGIMEVFGSIHTTYWDAVGNPALVVPMGFTDAGLPVSLQLAASPFAEATLVRTGNAFQSATDWHVRVPELVAAAAAL
ncbi:MAG TPA: amidase [Acidimicrobiia bacterium]|jgi:aspartyl-tRNA(Asn)/glutamyl-tRNA(Gln) amidotransferase subunit A